MGSRALVGATVAYGVLIVAGLIALGTLPAAAETGTQVVAWFREHRDGVRWTVWLSTVATPSLALMIALLRRLLPVPHRDVFLIGAVTYVASKRCGRGHARGWHCTRTVWSQQRRAQFWMWPCSLAQS